MAVSELVSNVSAEGDSFEGLVASGGVALIGVIAGEDKDIIGEVNVGVSDDWDIE